MKKINCVESKYTAQLDELRPNPKNPKEHTKEQIAHLKRAFIQMGFNDPIGVWGDQKMIVEGHGRYMALKELSEKDGYALPEEGIPIVRLDHLSPVQRDAYMLEHNHSTMETDWDSEMLDSVLKELSDNGMDMTEFGLGESKVDDLDDLFDDKYNNTAKGEILYEPKETHHEVKDLYRVETKFDEDIDQIEDEEMRRFLRARAAWFTKFDFAKIADYYAYQATEQEQKIFERLALVLLDEDKLYENGYADLMRQVDEADDEDDADGGESDD